MRRFFSEARVIVEPNCQLTVKILYRFAQFASTGSGCPRRRGYCDPRPKTYTVLGQELQFTLRKKA
jgi:hypothetical protein